MAGALFTGNSKIAELVVKKRTRDGMTIAVARRL